MRNTNLYDRLAMEHKLATRDSLTKPRLPDSQSIAIGPTVERYKICLHFIGLIDSIILKAFTFTL